MFQHQTSVILLQFIKIKGSGIYSRRSTGHRTFQWARRGGNPERPAPYHISIIDNGRATEYDHVRLPRTITADNSNPIQPIQPRRNPKTNSVTHTSIDDRDGSVELSRVHPERDGFQLVFAELVMTREAVAEGPPSFPVKVAS